MRRAIALFLSAMCLTVSQAIAQNSVSGTVKDAQGLPLIGAAVIVQGTTNGCNTDPDGGFKLNNVAPDAVLNISYVGFLSQEVPVGSRSYIDITLEEETQSINEVVVIGYGSLSKKEVSSSIVQVDRSEFMQGAMSNPMEMLTGKVAGLNVVNTSAANPNAGSDLQIRGAMSINSGNSPLIVIDGMVGGDIRNLSAQDIESMTVLKDGASSAIYGTRGANGVILITTKQGSGAGAGSHITYDSYFGTNFAKAYPEVLSADEFRRSMRGIDYGASTNWYDALIRKFSYENNQYVALDGSTGKGTDYNVSLNYKQATGLDIASARKEYGGRFSVRQKALNNILEIATSLSARRVHEDWANTGQFDNALSLNPTMPIYNEDGSFYHPITASGLRNPVEDLTVSESGGDRVYLLGTASAKVRLFQDTHHMLTTQLDYSLHYNDLNQHYFTPSTSAESMWGGYAGSASLQYQKWWTSQVEWLVNYTFDYCDHSLKAVAGYSFSQDDYEGHDLWNADFQYDSFLWHHIQSGSYLADGKASMNSYKTRSRLIGVFGRVNYDWKQLLMVSASLRYEGSTKFGANNKWGYFPAVSAAWEMANMPFLKDHGQYVSSLKLRASYGVTGRTPSSPYQSLATYGSTGESTFIDGAWVNGYGPTSNANPDLKWERSIDINVGVDFSLFKNRLRGSVEYFDRSSRDLLYTYTAPQPPMIYNTILVNVGSTSNRGVELAISGEPVQNRNFSWTTGINFSYGKTYLTKLSNDVYQASYLDLYRKPGLGTTEYFFRVAEGGKIGQFYGYQHAGIDDNGQLLVYNKDGEVIPKTAVQQDDRRYIGNGSPTSYLSWTNTLRYKNWDLNFMFRGAFGFDILNFRRYGMGLKGAGTENVLREAYTKYNHITSDGSILSSFFLEKGDYFKLENITLGYNFRFKPTSHVEALRLYGSVKNICTFTGYTGNDPSIVPVTGLTPGVDTGSAYPTALQATIGITLTFH